MTTFIHSPNLYQVSGRQKPPRVLKLQFNDISVCVLCLPALWDGGWPLGIDLGARGVSEPETLMGEGHPLYCVWLQLEAASPPTRKVLCAPAGRFPAQSRVFPGEEQAGGEAVPGNSCAAAGQSPGMAGGSVQDARGAAQGLCVAALAVPARREYRRCWLCSASSRASRSTSCSSARCRRSSASRCSSARRCWSRSTCGMPGPLWHSPGTATRGVPGPACPPAAGAVCRPASPGGACAAEPPAPPRPPPAPAALPPGSAPARPPPAASAPCPTAGTGTRSGQPQGVPAPWGCTRESSARGGEAGAGSAVPTSPLCSWAGPEPAPTSLWSCRQCWARSRCRWALAKAR